MLWTSSFLCGAFTSFLIIGIQSLTYLSICFVIRKSNPDIQKFMDQQGFGQDYSKLESYYIQR